MEHQKLAPLVETAVEHQELASLLEVAVEHQELAPLVETAVEHQELAPLVEAAVQTSGAGSFAVEHQELAPLVVMMFHCRLNQNGTLHQTLDYTLQPPAEDKSICDDISQESFSSFSSLSDSDVILRSEENIITVDIDSSTEPPTVETSTQNDPMSSCK